MMIACLGWGSLVWDPRDLPVASDWHTDGPSLAIEFARQSNDGRISLVLTDAAQHVQVLWCALKSDTADQAFAALVAREGITARDPSRVIGLWKNGDKPRDRVGATVSEWATVKSIDAVTWTALGAKFAVKIALHRPMRLCATFRPSMENDESARKNTFDARLHR